MRQPTSSNRLLAVGLGHLLVANLVIGIDGEGARPLLEALERVRHVLVLGTVDAGEVVDLALGLAAGGAADGRVLGEEVDALGQLVRLDPAEEVVVVVDHLELEPRGLADDVADLGELGLVLAGDLDDQVLVADGERRLLDAHAVDAAVDGLLGLGDGVIADLGLLLAAEVEGELLAVGAALELELGVEVLEEGAVDLLRVGGVDEGERDGARLLLALGDLDLGRQLGELFDGGGLVAGVEAEGGGERGADTRRSSGRACP